PKLQLMIYGENIGEKIIEISDKNIVLESISKADNPNYLFLDLDLSNTKKPQTFDIHFKGGSKDLIYSYELKQRRSNSANRIGFNSSDVIYLITPDRFANGNSSNDIHTEMKEKTMDRKHDYARHGGDIKGITNHLDYIHNMGFTAIWPTPVLTNDMPESSYHGYAMTDFYQVDPRFGTLDEYIHLSKKAKEKGIKLIMDQVANHCGSEHWWMKDLPFDNWINYQEELESKNLIITNHRRTSNQDMYASQYDKDLMSKGWFVTAMPDLNQQNPFMAKYIIQNSIWWIETIDLGGIRQDTYPYSNKIFMSNWAGAIMHEYPNFSIVGEEWSYNPLLIGYWQKGSKNKDGYESNLRSTMDFPMQKAIVEGLNEEESWDTGLVKLYEGLANDFGYAKPEDIMVFLDNHDKDRVFTEFNKDIVLTKMALSYLLVLPRIPQIYYGTEILMENSKKLGDHGLIRSDFPGGWKGDKVNAFTGKGLTSNQLEMQYFLKKILNYRKTSKAIHDGKTIHFAPKNGIYVLFRKVNDEVVVLIINKNKSPGDLDLKRFKEIGIDGQKLKNIISGVAIIWSDTLKLDSKGSILLTSKLK
ncbi:MAG: glycoside hydrolase family 13 protein, partial [Flavobacteriaceae bacterium]|nr:glycoside hydrolase family 13 protein [Flavobacteriaceae bacterium]